MYRSRISIVLAAAYALAAGAVFACQEVRLAVVDHITFAVRRAREWLVDFLIAPIRKVLARFSPWVMALPGVKMIAAKLYLLRQVRRERPRFEPQWRMCPSG